VQQVVNIGWGKHAGLNCYAGHGATELSDFGADQSRMTLAECKTQCYLMTDCDGIVYEPQDGQGFCFLRADIKLAQCEISTGSWDTHLMVTSKIPEDSRPCFLHTNISIADCDTTSEDYDTHTRSSSGRSPWWLTTNFAERAIMPRHYSCTSSGKKTCTLPDIQVLLDGFEHQGFNVINIDWPVDSGPDSLYEGFGARDYFGLDPLLGSNPHDNATVLAEWKALVSDIHSRGMRVVSDFNPSYFWSGAPAFKQALADVHQYGPVRANQPPGSPARWFRWTSSLEDDSCRNAKTVQPADDKALDGFTDAWIKATGAEACYWGIWGRGQPAADLASEEWQAEVARIFTFWVTDMGLDGFMLDAPVDYLGATSTNGDHYYDGGDMHQQDLARRVRQVIVDPVHALGAMVMGELYSPASWSRPTVGKMLDGGRNTDLPDGSWLGFPGQFRALVVSGDAFRVESVLEATVDRYVGWYGTPRSEAWYNNSERGVAALDKTVLQAAATALLAGYYVTRMGAQCKSPHKSYGPSPAGDQWPGGCFGNWLDTFGVDTSDVQSDGGRGVSDSSDVRDQLYATLRALPNISALHPGTTRTAVPVTGAGTIKGVYAALRTARPEAQAGAGAEAGAIVPLVVVVLNLGAEMAKVGLGFEEACKAGMLLCPQPAPALLVAGGGGGGGGGVLPIPASGEWQLEVPPLSWAVYQMQEGQQGGQQLR
jgi:hypothetical protein